MILLINRVEDKYDKVWFDFCHHINGVFSHDCIVQRSLYDFILVLMFSMCLRHFWYYSAFIGLCKQQQTIYNKMQNLLLLTIPYQTSIFYSITHFGV